MAAGDLKGFLSGNGLNLTDPFSAVGSVNVNVNDLVYVSICQQTARTSVSVDDNLGNTYTDTNAGSDTGTSTGRAFWARVTNPGVLTSVNVQSSTTNTTDWIVYAAVFEGPFVLSPLDANPPNTTDNSSPISCPPTGVLAQAEELVVSWVSSSGSAGVAAYTADSPMTLVASELFDNAIRHGLAYKKVSSTVSTTPSFSTPNSPGNASQGTNSFKINNLTISDIILAANTTLSVQAQAIRAANALLAGNTTLSIQTRGRLVARATLAANTSLSTNLAFKGKLEVFPLLSASTTLRAIARQRWASSASLAANTSVIINATVLLKAAITPRLAADTSLTINMTIPTALRLAITAVS